MQDNFKAAESFSAGIIENLNQYEDASKSLDKLTKGTNEWREA
jgi:hypothetical protein